MYKVMCILGTRPEAIKMAPVIKAFKHDSRFKCITCVTAQHREMLDQVLRLFDLSPDYDLNIMQPQQDLFDVTTNILMQLKPVLRGEQPDAVLVQGDTTTCFAGALAAFYCGIPVGHIEAGLRSHNLHAPFPEEGNRTLTTRIATWHFAPTATAKANLLREGIPEQQIFITGNTVIDALLWVKTKVAAIHSWGNIFGKAQFVLDNNLPFVLITGHRRENFGLGFQSICKAIAKLATKYQNWHFIYPVHLNKNVQEPVNNLLGNIANIHLLRPLDYAPFVYLMNKAYLILTDSGGIQEEAPSLGKPVLVMRDVTERPEAVTAGTVKLVGTKQEQIMQEMENLLNADILYQNMAKIHNPYGDGKAAQRIVGHMASMIN